MIIYIKQLNNNNNNNNNNLGGLISCIKFRFVSWMELMWTQIANYRVKRKKRYLEQIEIVYNNYNTNRKYTTFKKPVFFFTQS